MKILITGNTNYDSFNGQTVFMINLAEGLVKRGNEVLLLVPSSDGKAKRNIINGVQIQQTNSIGLKFWHPDAIAAIFPQRIVHKTIDEFKPDIIHIHDHYPLSVCVHRYARNKKIKVIGTNHFMPENLAPHVNWISQNKTAFEWVMWKWMLNLFNQLDAVTAPSRTAVNILRKNGLRTPVCPVSNGVNLDRFHIQQPFDKKEWRLRYGFDTERTLFLFVGRVDGEKHIDVLLHALSHTKNDNIQLGIVGKGTDTERLKQITRDLQLKHLVHYTGFVPGEELPAVLNAADIFTMPSEAELQSIATLEAMACGKPILAANSQALPELVTHGLNGYLFNAGDNIDAAHWMTVLASHSEQWQEMSKASLAKVEPHSIDNSLYTYEKLYEKAISGSLLPQLTPAYHLSLRKIKTQP